MKDLKQVYKANTKEQTSLELEGLSIKWGSKYPIVCRSWKKNWKLLTTYSSIHSSDTQANLYSQCY
ncbi:transposase [Fulvivirga sp. 29W222]|uniref:Transposase n=1 Tax=Fulvivirga marina TaxID=2494733 RepID=A0A937FWX5_9BACT|nr:transposase [Fulvivirga marina]